MRALKDMVFRGADSLAFLLGEATPQKVNYATVVIIQALDDGISEGLPATLLVGIRLAISHRQRASQRLTGR